MTTEISDDPRSELATFVASLSFDDVPDDAVTLIERAVLDTVGVTLAGSTTDTAQRVRSAVATTGGDTTLLGVDDSLPRSDAVFVNATAGHCLDFDDVALPVMDGHPSVPMVAPLLAVGEGRNATGEALIAAYAAGFETQHYVAQPISPTHYEDGWHATSTIGTFGTAAAVAHLLGLSAEEVAHAVNIAASMPAGLKRNFGSMTKPVHVGQAARSGTTAALLAAEGVTADASAVAGDRGFLDLYSSDEPDRDRFPVLGEEWALSTDGIDVKKYPCCYYTHAAIYGAAELSREHEIDPETIDAVRVTASRGAEDALHHADPSTGLEAKFSMEYVVARALVDGGVGLAAFDDDRVGDADVQAIRERVSFDVDPDLEYDSNAATIEVTTTAGAEYERTQERPPGTNAEPLSLEELQDKYRMCGERVDGFDAVESTLESLTDLRSVSDVSTVLAEF
ncbi:MmgE/PrpD family protein [Natronolimnohabitans innermongolicus]|uniref:MmgE/PrpD family protein n=1 Tax=Natronolimnohabitans innermongolicus JCM 12255 TaxID=1227499 RepID=L9WPZ6_9EURY|nr:MmgE/PrpD family protein [Natronolimnohabitans innermongolicus]ELY50418.1 MmgE/PrpD family protein [Natronolimnohabitans innermongolicus JCM 12255]